MIKLLNYDKVKEELLSCRGNLRKLNFDEVLSGVSADIVNHVSNLDKGSTYVFFQGSYSFWFELNEIAKVLVDRYRYRKEYRFNLTHVCQSDEALLVM